VDTEAHIHASLSHSAVVPLLLVAEDTRHIYLVMEYADGGDLRRQMASIGERRLRDSVIQPLLSALVLLHQQVGSLQCSMGRQIPENFVSCKGLVTRACASTLSSSSAAAQGVVHRDVKPDNVLMHRNSAQLADFGLAVYCNPSQPSSRRHSYLEQQQAASAAKDREPSLPLQNQVSMSSMQSSYSTALVDCSIASASTIGSSASTAAALEECTGCHSDSEQSEQDTAVLVDDLHMRTSANSDAAALDAAAHTVSAHQLLCHSRLRRPISSPELMASASGTPLYTAPEVLLAMFQSRPVHDVVSHKVRAH
jgi:serine/threonine protein kinase